MKYVRTKTNIPYGDAAERFPNTEIFEGAVAIFWFPPSELYPEGTKHVAYVEEIQGNEFRISQTNKERCTYTEEWVSMDDPLLIGFATYPHE